MAQPKLGGVQLWTLVPFLGTQKSLSLSGPLFLLLKYQAFRLAGLKRKPKSGILRIWAFFPTALHPSGKGPFTCAMI